MKKVSICLLFAAIFFLFLPKEVSAVDFLRESGINLSLYYGNFKQETLPFPAAVWEESGRITLYGTKSAVYTPLHNLGDDRYLLSSEEIPVEGHTLSRSETGEEPLLLTGSSKDGEELSVLIFPEETGLPQNLELFAPGWNQTEQGWFLCSETKLLTGWQMQDGKWYWLGEDGLMQTGWLWWNNDWYYLNPSGSMATGWLWWENDWYYLSSNGSMATGWFHDGNGWYYADQSGRMLSNTRIDGWYLSQSGKMAETDFTLTAADRQLLDKAAQSANNSPAGYYLIDLATGQSVSNKPGEWYYLASVLKAPYCMWIYMQADTGKTDLSQTMVFEESMRKDGSGIIQNMPAGTVFTMAELLEYAIRYSDNSAIDMLLHRYQFSDFKAYVTGRGLLSAPSGMETFSRTSLPLRDIASLTQAVADYLYTGTTGARTLRDDLCSTDFRCIQGGETEVAQKYGYWEGWFHTAAVIYGDRPCVLVVCTGGQEEEDTTVFQKMYEAVLQITAD